VAIDCSQVETVSAMLQLTKYQLNVCDLMGHGTCMPAVINKSLCSYTLVFLVTRTIFVSLLINRGSYHVKHCTAKACIC